MRWMLATVVAFLLFATPAQAALIQDFGDFRSGTNGIVLGPDGNFWVAEEFNDSVARMTPSGTVLNRYSVGAGPTSVATSTNGRVWVSVTGADKLVWFDATSANPTAHDLSTAVPGGCGPVGIVAGPGNGRMYVSFPDVEDPTDPCTQSRIGYVADTGVAGITSVAGLGTVFDLAVSNGKVYAPDAFNDAVRRLSLDLVQETSISAPGGPDGITVAGAGSMWVTLYNTGAIASFASTQNGGTVTTVNPVGDSLGEVFGIAADFLGNVYVTSKANGKLARFSPATNTWRFYTVGGEPWQITNGADGDFYFTDQSSSRVRRFLSGAPRATTGGATNGTATATVDSRGNDTTVTFEYGPTTGYGQSVSTTIPAAAGPAPVALVLPGLAGGTTYHVRVRATNEEGSAVGGDATFLTAPADADHDGVSPPLDCNDSNAAIRPGAVDKPGDKIDQDCNGKDAAFPVLAAATTFGYGFFGSRTAITKLEIAKLAGGETVTITCKSKRLGCPFAKKTYKNVKKTSKRKLTSLFGSKHKLRTGAKVEVRITKAGTVGSSATLTVGKRKKQPKIVRKAINP